MAGIVIMVKKSVPEVAKRLFENTQQETFTYKELSGVLRLSEGNLRYMVCKGEIPYVKLGRRVRFLRDDIVIWLQRNRIGATNHVS